MGTLSVGFCATSITPYVHLLLMFLYVLALQKASGSSRTFPASVVKSDISLGTLAALSREWDLETTVCLLVVLIFPGIVLLLIPSS